MFGSFVDLITDYIPGGDIIDDIFGIGNGGDPRATAIGNGGVGIQMPPLKIPRPKGTIFDKSGDDRPPVMARDLDVTPTRDVYGNCVITLPLEYRAVAYAPPGYVAVDTDNDGITDTAMLKEVAIACKLWKRRPKALLTASDRKTLNRATSVMNRVDNVVKQTNKLRGQARLTKSRPSSR